MALSTSAIQLRGHLSSRCHVTPRETSDTGKPKSMRGDRLGFQRTLVDLMLSAVSRTLCICLHLAETKPDKSLPRPYRLNPCREQLGQWLRQLCTDNSVASSNIFVESGQIENNDKTLKELATPDMVRRPPQALEGIPCGLLHNEAIGDTGGLHQNKGVSLDGATKDWLYLHPVLFNT
ncbi:hypothetical protein CR513_31271, partial [Mucuna pruriens]